MSGSALVDVAEAVLAAVVNHWPTVPDVSLPYLQALPADRQYVSIGTPPADCEQLVVSVERSFGNDGSPALERIVPLGSGIPYLRAEVVAIQILRCVSVVDAVAGEPLFPDPGVMQAEAGAILTDADVVLRCVIAAQAAGDLANCGGMALENWRALTPEGGLAGGVTRLRLNLF